MRLSFLLGLAVAPLVMMQPAHAQDTNAYVVAYIEVVPTAADETAGMLRQLATASRRDAGAVRFEVLQRINYPGHFVVLEAWKDAKAAEAHNAADHTKQFRERLQHVLASPYDERPHTGIATAETVPGPAAALAGGIYAVTHVDFIPPKKDEGIAALKTLADPSRKEDGNARYDVWQQNSRPNHLTLVEIWKDQKALEAHWVAAHTKAFRQALLPMSGSLYDERLYRALN